MRILFVSTLMLLGAVAPGMAQSGSTTSSPYENRALQSACAQGSTSGLCRQYGPPKPPDRPYTPPRSSGEIAPPMERVQPIAPLSPRVGN